MQCSNKLKAYALVELLISNAIFVVMLCISMHYLALVSKTYLKIQRDFAYDEARLVARHYLLQDVKNAADVQFSLQRLMIIKDQIITYDLRPSVIPKNDPRHAFALYREDGITRAEALVEGIIDWRISLEPKVIKILIMFKDQQNLEIKYARPLPDYN